MREPGHLALLHVEIAAFHVDPRYARVCPVYCLQFTVVVTVHCPLFTPLRSDGLLVSVALILALRFAQE